jgi:hypothetical protein
MRFALISDMRIKIIMTALILFAWNASAQAVSLGDMRLPPVIEVQRQAVRHARFDLSEIHSWKKRSRQAALVPRLQIDFGKRMRDNIDIDIQDNVYVGSSGIVVGPEEGSYSNVYTSDLTIGVRAVWELGEAVFSPRELAVSAEARNVARATNLLLADVNHHYYIVESCPAEVEILKKVKESDKKPENIRHKIFLRQVACRESSAALDALTGGWWSSALESNTEICDHEK